MDDLIDSLIKPPRVRYAGFNWHQAPEKLQPNGAGHQDKLLGERLAEPRPDDPNR